MARGWRRLVEDHLWLVNVVAFHFIVDEDTRDDLRGVGYEALVRAARRYSPSGGATFKTYAWRCIYWTMHNYASRDFSREEERQIILAVLYPERTTTRWSRVVDWSTVSAVEELVLWCLFVLGLTYTETGRVLGFTRVKARDIEQGALERLAKLP